MPRWGGSLYRRLPEPLDKSTRVCPEQMPGRHCVHLESSLRTTTRTQGCTFGVWNVGNGRSTIPSEWDQGRSGSCLFSSDNGPLRISRIWRLTGCCSAKYAERLWLQDSRSAFIWG